MHSTVDNWDVVFCQPPVGNIDGLLPRDKLVGACLGFKVASLVESKVRFSILGLGKKEVEASGLCGEVVSGT